MTLEIRKCKSNSVNISLTKCPACGMEFDYNSGSVKRRHFLNEHGPSDFGLTPLRSDQ